MARIAYVNGRYVQQAQAMVHVEDRGYQFSDGIYEYIAFYNRVLLDEEAHWRRLERSLGELGIAMPVSLAALRHIAREMIERNGRNDGGIYIQVTRGVAKRDHVFPKHVKPTLVMTVCGAKLPKPHEIREGVRVITHPDLRWARRDIKSVSLLANVLARQEAAKHHAREAWLLLDEENTISEGAVSNAFIIGASGEIITHPANARILGGIAREMVLKLARDNGIAVDERPFTLAEVKTAAEAFITSTSANVLPVVKVDGFLIGGGRPGPVTRKLQALFKTHVLKQTGREL